MIITTYQKATRLKTWERIVRYDCSKLQNVNSKNLIGIKIDKKRVLERPVDNVANKVSCSIVLLHRINDYLLVETQITYYKTFIQPHMDYCNIIWGQSNHIARIHKLQKLAIIINHNKPKLTPSNPFFQESVLFCQYRTESSSEYVVQCTRLYMDKHQHIYHIYFIHQT